MEEKEITLVGITNRLCIRYPTWSKERIIKIANEMYKDKKESKKID